MPDQGIARKRDGTAIPIAGAHGFAAASFNSLHLASGLNRRWQVRLDIEINKGKGRFFVTPRRSSLALEEEYISNTICIKPKIEGADIELGWKLVSNNCNKEGFLKLEIGTYLIQEKADEYVDFRQHVRVEKSIEDYFERDEQ